LTAGDDTGQTIPMKLREGTRGNVAALLRFPHGWSPAECAEASKKLDSLAMQMVDVVRQPQESIVFNPMQGTPTEIPDP